MNVGPSLSRPSRNQFAKRSSLATRFSSVYPPLYDHFTPMNTRLNTKAITKLQISNERAIVPTDFNRSMFSGGSDTTTPS